MVDKKINITSIEDGETPKQPDLSVDSLDLVDVIKPQTAAHNNAPSPDFVDKVDFGWINRLVIGASLIWLIIVSALLFGVLDIINAWQAYSPLQWASIAALVLGPILLIIVTAYGLKQLAKLSRQAHMLNRAAAALTTPDKTVIGKSKIMAEAIAAQIDHVDTKLDTSLARLGTMDKAVQIQANTLQAANEDVRETVGAINDSVQVQKQTLLDMTETLDLSMVNLSNTLIMHTDNLAKAVQIAEQKIKEARISVEGATAKINSASDIVRSNTVQAASTLSASHEDIKSLGDIIRQRSEELDTVYKKHAGELTAMIEHLRDEQTSLGASMQERLTKMRDLSLSAQASAESLTEASRSGKETIEALAESASLADSAVKARFAEMRDMVQYSTEHAQSISDMAAQRVQDSLELTRKEITRIEREMAGLQSRIGNEQHKSLETHKTHETHETHNSPKAHKSLELVPDDSEMQAEPPNQNNPTKPRKPRRTRLKLKPVVEIVEDLPRANLLPTHSDPTSNTKIDLDEKINPELEERPLLELGGGLIDPDVLRQNIEKIPPDPQAPVRQASVPQIPDPQIKEQTTPHPDEATIRRSVPIDAGRKTKSKSGGFLRNIFKSKNQTDTPSSLDIVTPPNRTPGAKNSTRNPARNPDDAAGEDEDILADLAQLGLSVNAVVDDGCIIEASNARATQGHEAMSKCVAMRLKNPVEHLVRSLAVNDELSDKAINFATRFNQSVEALAQNREAVRTKLESETGRAYLLCDAALNYGRG